MLALKHRNRDGRGLATWAEAPTDRGPTTPRTSEPPGLALEVRSRTQALPVDSSPTSSNVEEVTLTGEELRSWRECTQIKDPQLVPQLKSLQHGKVVSSKIFHLPGFGRVGQGDPRLDHHVPGNDTGNCSRPPPFVAEVSR